MDGGGWAQNPRRVTHGSTSCTHTTGLKRSRRINKKGKALLLAEKMSTKRAQISFKRAKKTEELKHGRTHHVSPKQSTEEGEVDEGRGEEGGGAVRTE